MVDKFRGSVKANDVPSVIGSSPPPSDTRYRAVHEVNLSALSHNYLCVEKAAASQKCSVIVVVKADGYGHGAIATAIHLADSVGADAFAVATLEEAVALRRAFEKTPIGGAKRIYEQAVDGAESLSRKSSQNSCEETTRIYQRPPHVRILVLGPPVGYPRCFDTYYYENIEVMVSGPEVAKALMAWVADPEERKRIFVERSALEAKTRALNSVHTSRDEESNGQDENSAEDKPISRKTSAATLSNVSGQDLAKEVKAILMQQDLEKKKQAQLNGKPASKAGSGRTTPVGSTPVGEVRKKPSTAKQPLSSVFGGIEAAASDSRNREKAARAQDVFVETSDDDVSALTATTAKTGFTAGGTPRVKRKLRWHALVDSGMGRLGFKTDVVSIGETSVRIDSVAVIKEMVDAELVAGAPLEFYGMCTHMAEAMAGSNYTDSQIEKFKSLLKRVREAGVSVPTISTDNSAALLTPTLCHFDPDELLRQPETNSRGFVRTGGAIYGQRPAFKQLRPASTLKAAVRHVAELKKGESVGYDRAYVAPYDVRIATLTIGFADGYPRELGNGGGEAVIRDEKFKVVGNVCMDMLMVELGPPAGIMGREVAVGDVATLWGVGGPNLQDIAQKLKTTQSALTCGLDKTRVLRELSD